MLTGAYYNHPVGTQFQLQGPFMATSCSFPQVHVTSDRRKRVKSNNLNLLVITCRPTKNLNSSKIR